MLSNIKLSDPSADSEFYPLSYNPFSSIFVSLDKSVTFIIVVVAVVVVVVSVSLI